MLPMRGEAIVLGQSVDKSPLGFAYSAFFKIIELLLGERGVKWPAITRLLRSTQGMLRKFAGRSTLIHTGLLFFKQVLSSRSRQSYTNWIEAFDSLDRDDHACIRQHIGMLEYKPRILLIIFWEQNDLDSLRMFIDSVKSQLYPYWQLIIVHNSEEWQACQVLARYQNNDDKIRSIYLHDVEHRDLVFKRITKTANSDYIAFLAEVAVLSEHALYMVAAELNKYGQTDLLYSDEDRIDAEGRRISPDFKPGWDPDLFHSQNYFGCMTVFRTTAVQATGGPKEGFGRSWVYHLALRVAADTHPGSIRHIPHILCHRRIGYGTKDDRAEEKRSRQNEEIRALEDVFQSRGIQAKIERSYGGQARRVVYALPAEAPLVSLIVPTAAMNQDALARFAEGILTRTDYPCFELVFVVNNVGSKRGKALLRALSRDPRVRLLAYDRPFNYSEIYNVTVPRTTGQLLGMLNDDVDVISPDWLKEMVSNAMRREVGVVGAMLYYRHDVIQHAGLVLGIGGVAAHIHKGFYRGHAGYHGRARLTRNFSAVTGACMVMRRQVFNEVGGFDQNLAIAYNDVDFCLRIRKRGYGILWTPHAELYHIESASRGPDTTARTAPRFRKEVEYMENKWGASLIGDPFYNPNLSLKDRPFELSFPPRVVRPWLTPASLPCDSDLLHEQRGMSESFAAC